MTLSTRLTPAELRAIESPVTAAAIKLRLGAVDDDLRETLAAVINVAYYICKSTQRHAHLIPEIMRASDAALDGYNDVDALDGALEIYRALIRTTPRKAIHKAINRALRENS